MRAIHNDAFFCMIRLMDFCNSMIMKVIRIMSFVIKLCFSAFGVGHQEGDLYHSNMMEAELCSSRVFSPSRDSSRVFSPSREESGDEELSVLPRHTKVIVTGNNRTKSVLVGLQGVVKKAVGLGGWHWLVHNKITACKFLSRVQFCLFVSAIFVGFIKLQLQLSIPLKIYLMSNSTSFFLVCTDMARHAQ